MYHGIYITNERQARELHMVWINGSMNAGGDLGSAAKGSDIGLEVAGSSPVGCRFSHSLLFPTM